MIMNATGWASPAAQCEECGKEFMRWQLNGYGRCSACQTAITNAKHFTKDFDLTTGDRIAITVSGRTYTGAVLTAYFWGEHDGWYVEFTTADHYSYWKQGVDGGTIAKVAQ